MEVAELKLEEAVGGAVEGGEGCRSRCVSSSCMLPSAVLVARLLWAVPEGESKKEIGESRGERGTIGGGGGEGEGEGVRWTEAQERKERGTLALLESPPEAVAAYCKRTVLQTSSSCLGSSLQALPGG